jgi:undecaprenyl-diphosphatase
MRVDLLVSVRARLAATGTALLATVLFLGYLVRRRIPALDAQVLESVARQRNTQLGVFANAVSTVLSPTLASAALAVLVFAAGYAWLRRRRREAGLLLRACVLLGTGWATVLLKQVYRRPRPRGNPGWSFPSGHVTAVTAVSLAVVLLCVWLAARWYPAVLLLATLAVALTASSRVVLGVHYLTDVVGAAVGTVGVGLLTAAVLWPVARRPAAAPPARVRRDPAQRAVRDKPVTPPSA